MATTLTVPASLQGKRQRIARPADTNYTLNIAQRVSGGLIACRMDMVGTSTSERKPYEVAERVALIDVCGVLSNDPYWYDETGYDDIQNEMRMAGDDADVDGILILVNSPGGETDNAFETADVIKKVAAVKPVWGVAAPMAYSAGYLLLSQASKVYVPPVTGGVGSIGVYGLHLDFSEYLKKQGIAATFVSEGKGKTDGNPYEPLSEEARQKLVLEIQRLYGEFLSRVASGRSLSESAIIKFGAALFEGSKASLGAGLADLVGSPETAWTDLATRVAGIRQGTISATAEVTPKGENVTGQNPNPGAAAPAAGTPAPVVPAAAAPPAAAAVPAVPAAETAVTDAQIEAARSSGYSEAAEVVQLCELAGKPGKAAKFITDRTKVADVRTELLKEKAAAGNPGEIRGAILPHEAAGGTAPAKTCKELAQDKGRQEGWLK